MNNNILHYNFAALTAAGTDNAYNQDRAMVEGNLLENGALTGTSEGIFLAAVCDGGEGAAQGEKAADIAATSLRNASGESHSPFSLCRAIYQANEEVLNAGELSHNTPNCTTTLALLYLDEKSYYVFNAGDTRVYWHNARGLVLLSSKTNTTPVPHDTTKCLGVQTKDLSLSVAGNTNLRIEEGQFLLCTNGVYRHLSEEDLLTSLTAKTSLIDTCLHLEATAKHNGSTDSRSIVLVEVCTQTANKAA